MLILGRKPGDTVVITCPTGEKIIIGYTTKNSKTGIKFMIDAPRHINILRGELEEEIEDDRRGEETEDGN